MQIQSGQLFPAIRPQALSTQHARFGTKPNAQTQHLAKFLESSRRELLVQSHNFYLEGADSHQPFAFSLFSNIPGKQLNDFDLILPNPPSERLSYQFIPKTPGQIAFEYTENSDDQTVTLTHWRTQPKGRETAKTQQTLKKNANEAIAAQVIFNQILTKLHRVKEEYKLPVPADLGSVLTSMFS